jgi:hypothetical protein
VGVRLGRPFFILREVLVLEIIYYPDRTGVENAIKKDEPLLMLVSFDKKKVLLSNIDDAVEHYILLKKLGYPETGIDKYYRVVVNKDGADWTFVCPADYKNIEDKDRRIKIFYSEGVSAISEALKIIGYEIEINIPKRYKRHFDMLK